MSPLVAELKKNKEIRTVVCTTGQHKLMLSQVLDDFNIIPDYELDIMQPEQTLYDVTQRVLLGIMPVLQQEQPDIMLVHGDTTTAFASALSAFYSKIPVGHVEAGLRTKDIYSPFPEEFNRKAVAIVTKMHFAPTENAKRNLLAEGYDAQSIYVTGNTAIDALRTTVKKDYSHDILDWAEGSRLILLTAHRRENLGGRMEMMFNAIKRIVNDDPGVKVVYPVHLNPAVLNLAHRILGDNDRIKLIEPLGVLDFHNFLARSYLVLTDSGGIQEEAPHFGKPVLVLRDTTERPEGVEAGTLVMAGTQEQTIYEKTMQLLFDKNMYEKISQAINPYGDGFASQRIVKAILGGGY